MEDVEEKDAQEILTECLSKFGTADFIMEPEIFSQLKKYFQAGGNPEQVIDLLSKNYLGKCSTSLFKRCKSSRNLANNVCW